MQQTTRKKIKVGRKNKEKKIHKEKKIAILEKDNGNEINRAPQPIQCHKEIP
jgi:hypothetical protein